MQNIARRFPFHRQMKESTSPSAFRVQLGLQRLMRYDFGKVFEAGIVIYSARKLEFFISHAIANFNSTTRSLLHFAKLFSHSARPSHLPARLPAQPAQPTKKPSTLTHFASAVAIATAGIARVACASCRRRMHRFNPKPAQTIKNRSCICALTSVVTTLKSPTRFAST